MTEKKKKTTRKKPTEKPKLIMLEPGTKFPECLTETELESVKMAPLPAIPIEKFPPAFGSDVSDDWMFTAAKETIDNDPEGIPPEWLMEGDNGPIAPPKAVRSALILPDDFVAAEYAELAGPPRASNKMAHPKLRPLQNQIRNTPAQPAYTPMSHVQVFDDTPKPVYENQKSSKSAVKRKPRPTTGIDYKFNEGELIAEIAEYLDSTYTQHYANTGNYQAMDIIIDAGHGMGFALGNVIKYNKRYGKKEGYNRKDLLKMIHYAILALYVHDYNVKAAQEPVDE